jgi:hypothetical protein
MNTLPIERTLAIYSTIANRSELKGTREYLSRHLQKVFLEGEHDPHRLTVHGLTYLKALIVNATVERPVVPACTWPRNVEAAGSFCIRP